MATRPDSEDSLAGTREDTDDARRAARGDRLALGRLYERHARMVHAIALVRVDRGEAEDVTHETFLRAMKSIGTLRDGEAVGPWLAQIARNAAVDHAKSRSRWRLYLRRGARQELFKDHARCEQSPAGGDVLRAIRSLPEAYHETLVLRLVEQMTGPQIATALGMTHGSVRVNLHRGIELLRAQLAKTGIGGVA